MKVQYLTELLKRELTTYLEAHPDTTREAFTQEVAVILEKATREFPMGLPDVVVTLDEDDPTLVHISFRLPVIAPYVPGQEN